MLLWMDGFEHYWTYPHAEEAGWSSPGNGGQIFLGAPSYGARTGVVTLQSTVAAGIKAARALPAATDPLLIGFGFSITNAPNDTRLWIVEEADAGGTSQSALKLNTDGSIAFQAVTGADTATTAPGVVKFATWQWLEMKFDRTNGTFVLYVDSVKVLDLTGVGYAASSITQVFFGRGNGITQYGADVFYDDVVVCDTTGTRNKTIAGPRQVITLMPAANGVAQDWTAVLGTGETAAWETLKDIPPDDATYVEATGPAASDFECVTLDASFQRVDAVAVAWRAFKSDVGAATAKAGLRGSSGTVAYGAAENLTTTAAYYLDVFETDPSGADFSPADLQNGALHLALGHD